MLVQTRPIPSLREVKLELARRKLGHYVELTSNITLHRWQWDLCEILERFRHEEALRLLIHGPPQFGKSIILTKRLPAWLLGHRPDRRQVIAAYNVTHATTLSATVRDAMRGHLHREVFPDPAGWIVEPSSEGEFFTELRKSRNDAQRSMRALGLQSGFTGSGADDVFIDDPYASADEARSETVNAKTIRFWTETAKPRINDETNVALMFHRYHESDMAGVLLETGKWEELRFPAIADDQGGDPTRQWRGIGEPLSPIRSIEFLEEIRAADPYVFAGQFQGRPRPDTGGLFPEGCFNYIDFPPRYTRWVRFWDLAVSAKQTADYTAGVLIGLGPDDRICIADVKRWKREWPETRDGVWENGRPYDPDATLKEKGILQVTEEDLAFIETLYNADLGERRPEYHVGIESQAQQLGLVQDLHRNPLFGRVPLWGETVSGKGDKKARAALPASRAVAGLVDIVKGPWNLPFTNETKVFDGFGLSNDDQVDGFSGAVGLIYAKTGSEVKEPERPKPDTLGFYRELGKQARQQSGATRRRR